MALIGEFFHEVTHRDFWLAEFLSSALLMGWAIINLASPDHLSQHNFGPLLAWVSEDHLEEASFLCGAAQFMSLLEDNRAFRAGCCSVVAFIYGSVGFGMVYKGGWPPGGIVFYAGFHSVNICAMAFNMLKRRGVT